LTEQDAGETPQSAFGDDQYDASADVQAGEGFSGGFLATEAERASVGESTPLEDDEREGTIPAAPLWAMKDRRHYSGPRAHVEDLRVRSQLGVGDEILYFIDDGRDHVMVGRRVGQNPDQCVYCLVGRLKLEEYQDLENGTRRLAEAFADAHDISLMGVYEDENLSSEVFVVQHYRHARDVPSEYLPPSPFIEFDEDLLTDE
jgi:hypothetical protein